jgi:hypothetical protein
MKNNINAEWFRNYLRDNRCVCDEIMGNTETWVKEDDKKLWAQFNGTLKVLEESTVKDVLNKLRLPFADFEKALEDYNKNLK